MIQIINIDLVKILFFLNYLTFVWLLVAGLEWLVVNRLALP